MTSELRATGITVRFGGLTVIDKVDLHLRSGEILGLIGPNGAGKTTFVNVLSGFQRPNAGRISVDDHDITTLLPAHRVRHGLVRTFQAVRLFPALTVAENIICGTLAMNGFPGPARERFDELISLLDLGDWLQTEANALPYGIERRVGIARALISAPAFILLDEPAAGMNDAEAMAFLQVVKHIQAKGTGILLIEHNMNIVFRLCDRVHVLQSGKTLATGTPEEIRVDPQVRTAYLGSAA